MMSILLLICLISVANSSVVVKASDEESKDNKTTITYMDIGNAASENNDNYIVIRDRSRNESAGRLFTDIYINISEKIKHCFDTDCKSAVSECKVKQGIFHFKLSSDDEEHPGSGQAY